MRTRTKAMKEALKAHGDRGCELCQKTRTLEAHHIIPMSFGGPDSLDNIICICEQCHAKLTPRSLLTKKGLYNKNPQHFFYHHFNEIAEAGDTFDFGEVCDYLDAHVFPLFRR